MEYRTLGRTGIKVSPLCLGAMMFGAWGTQDHDESIRIIHAALDAGINFVDTADVYSFGESEEIVGKALAKTKRHKVVLATKVHGQMGRTPTRRATRGAGSWRRATTACAVLAPTTSTCTRSTARRPRRTSTTLGALTDLVRAGKIRYFGSSTFPAHEIVEAQWVAERRARERFVTEQPPYSILVRGIEKDVLPMCQKYGMGVLSWSPLAGGWLSGAFGPGKENTSRRSAMLPHHYDMEVPGNRQKIEAVGELTKVADEAGLSLIQLALGFVLEHPAVTSPIIGPRTMEHLESQLPALQLRLGGRRARPDRRDRPARHRPQRDRCRLGAGSDRGQGPASARPLTPVALPPQIGTFTRQSFGGTTGPPPPPAPTAVGRPPCLSPPPPPPLPARAPPPRPPPCRVAEDGRSRRRPPPPIEQDLVPPPFNHASISRTLSVGCIYDTGGSSPPY